MISLDLAKRLRDAGLRWEPAPGDKFVLPDRGMDDEVFVLSNMTIDVHEFPTGRVIGFNGTVEWALDSVEAEAALWLPSEEQLRELLGGTFVRLYRSGEEYRVTLEVAGRRTDVVAGNPAEAYGRALLYLAAGEQTAWITHSSSRG
ncbi:MAG: pilus assembly protein CpaE [Actinomycetota bacterium]